MDIVERLNDESQCFCSIRKEAANEIERLREAFQNYIEHVGCGTAIRCEHCDAARAVLQQKESE